MYRRFFLTLWLAAVLLTACQPVDSSAPTETPAPTQVSPPTSVPHADVIRLALIGGTQLTNVWAYFDEPGTAYNNRAVQAEFWPSLFRLSPASGAVEPYIAGTVSPLEPDSGMLAANVTLRANLFWSDGSPLTAQDVAFTVNTALQFQLGLDWGAAYNPAILARAEALNPQTVRFYFRSQPSIADWQYGALQGPIVHSAYWGPKLVEAASLLTPNPDLDQEILSLQNQRSQLERELTDLTSQLAFLDPSSPAFSEVNTLIYAKQDEINSINTRIAARGADKETVFALARQALYALPAENEPTFGPFRPGRRDAGEFENPVNPFFPFAQPNFDRALYRMYPDQASAVQALFNGDVNVVLNDGGVTPPAQGESLPLPATGVTPQLVAFARSNLRALAFNLSRPVMGDINLRRAIACMGDGGSSSLVHYPDGLILSSTQFGIASDVEFPCEGLPPSNRLAEAVRIMEEGGYTWDVKPAWDGTARPGSGLRRGGQMSPAMTLLVAQEDPLRVSVAGTVVESMRVLGLNINLETAELPDVMFRVYDSHDYDVALLGWRLSRLPLYLCDWFGDANPFGYERVELAQHCLAFRFAPDLTTAQQEMLVVESLLAQDLPLAPIYNENGYDWYAGVAYPFASPLDGVTGLYGAPWLAIPVLP